MPFEKILFTWIRIQLFSHLGLQSWRIRTQWEHLWDSSWVFSGFVSFDPIYLLLCGSPLLEFGTHLYKKTNAKFYYSNSNRRLSEWNQVKDKTKYAIHIKMILSCSLARLFPSSEGYFFHLHFFSLCYSFRIIERFKTIYKRWKENQIHTHIYLFFPAFVRFLLKLPFLFSLSLPFRILAKV